MERRKSPGKNNTPPLFPIVAVGASAGGLDAFKRFLAELPHGFGFALVFIQHLLAKRKSLLPDLLRSKRPNTEINEISDGMKILPGRIYLSPPGKEISIKKGSFHVTPRREAHLCLPIDDFFESLAEEAGDRSIAVILSGAGTDGARGIQSIRMAGGSVFVQDPATAEFPGMPLAAIKTGGVDGVNAPEDIAREILKMQDAGVVSVSNADLMSPSDLRTFCRLIREKTGYSFDHYKKTVVTRRIRRRMYLHGVSSAPDYLKIIADAGSEALMLASDLMIGVTSFFRDRMAWKVLKIEVLRKFAAENDDSPVRVWTPACATGEEAYSIALMLRSELDLAGRRREIQIFATDVNDTALQKAREGTYPASIAADIPRDYMHRYFTYSENGLSATVSKAIREQVVFARQDLLIDPPFSRLDLTICRNLLIYLEPEAQEKCLSIFHYALKGERYLFLGNAESVGRTSALFESIGHKKCRIYTKVERSPSLKMPVAVPFAAERAGSVPPVRLATQPDRQPVTEFIQAAMLEEYAPSAIAVNQKYEILYHNGPTNRYLRQPRGAPTQNLLELFPEGLQRRIRAAVYRTTHDMKPVSLRTSITGRDDSKKRQVTLRISKLKENLFLIVFREKGVAPEQEDAVSLDTSQVEETAVRQLETELSATREALQSNIEQLKSLNEELQSSNEELQAANEELETSREELQSLNEEVITVNSQLQSKIEEEEEINDDLNNFLTSTNIPTIFLDPQFKVKRFTPAMSKIIKLIPADMGRPIIDMSQENLGPDFIADAKAVLDDLVPVKKEIAINGAWYLRATLPYRTSDNRIEGVVITYNEITELKRAEEALRKAHDGLELRVQERTTELVKANEELETEIAERKRAEDIAKIERQRLYDVLETLPVYVVLLSEDYHVPFANKFFRERFGESHGKRCFEYLFGRTEPCEICETYSVLKTSAPHHWEWTGPDSRNYDIYDFPFIDADGSRLILEMGIDITERKKAEAALKELNETLERRVAERTAELAESEERFRAAYEQAAVGIELVDLEGRFIRGNGKLSDILGYNEEELYKFTFSQITYPDDLRIEMPLIEQLITDQITNYSIEKRYIHKDGHDVWVRVTSSIAKTSRPYRISIIEDITDRKRAEAALRESEERYRNLFNTMDEGFCIIEMVFDAGGRPADYRFMKVNAAFEKQTGLHEAEGKLMRELAPAHEAYWFEIYGKIALTGEPLHFVNEARALDRWYDVYAYRVGKPEDRQVAIIFNDISARKRAEEELRESEQRLARAQEIAHLGSWELDLIQNKLTWSDEIYRIFGLKPQEFGATYEAFLEHVHPDDRAAVDAAYSSSVKEGKDSYEIEHRVVQKGTGEIRWVHEKCQHVRDDAGKIICSLGMVQDVTERKEAEDQLQKATDELKRSNVALRQFAYATSHDLREPLRNMASFVKLLERRYKNKIDEKADQYIDYIVDSSKRMQALIDDLLDYARLETKGKVLEPLNCNELIDRTITDLTASINESKAEVTHDLLPDVTADPLQLSRLFQNLISNAIKYRGTGTPRIHISASRGKDEWVFSVRDNGIGIDPEYFERIFVIFQRLHTREEYPGTGIGLAICKKIVELHGGRIWVDSEPGKGSTFYFSIPDKK